MRKLPRLLMVLCAGAIQATAQTGAGHIKIYDYQIEKVMPPLRAFHGAKALINNLPSRVTVVIPGAKNEWKYPTPSVQEEKMDKKIPGDALDRIYNRNNNAGRALL